MKLTFKYKDSYWSFKAFNDVECNDRFIITKTIEFRMQISDTFDLLETVSNKLNEAPHNKETGETYDVYIVISRDDFYKALDKSNIQDRINKIFNQDVELEILFENT